jgi:predicted RecA/RadA family phage recombinase
VPIENSLSFKGLQTSPNNLGAGSEGALVVADNVTIRYPDVLEPRRGQAVDAFGATVGAEIKQVSFFEDKVVAHTGTKVRVSGAASELTGTYTAADPDYRLKTAIAASTFFMATDKGVMALESSTSTVPRLTGIAEPLAPTASFVEDPTSPAPTIAGFLDPGKAVAYRVLFGYVDSNDAVHLGPPSVRVAVKNTSAGQASVTVVVPLLTVPVDAADDIVSGTFVRVYRSVMADTEALTGDELYLVNETVIDTSQYGVGDVIILADTARQEFAVQSAPLYTSPTQGGLPNDAPPFAQDIATWSQREWYANTNQPHSLTAQLIGVEGGGNPDLPATGLRFGDTITIAGVTFTAADETDFAARKFLVWTTGPGPEANISKTLYWLALVVNQWAIDNPTTFNIRAYLEPVVFGDDLLNFKIRFQRPTVDSTTNTSFDVVYAVQDNIATVTASGGGFYQVETTTDNHLLVDDWVSLYEQDTLKGDYKVTTIVSSTIFEIQSADPTIVDTTNVIRKYGESVWTPDLYRNPIFPAYLPARSDNERRVNYVYYSLPGEPEAVSAANFIPVGTGGKAVRRIVPQRDRLLVFKDEGTYAIYGDFPFQVSLIDDTVAILAPDSAVAVGSTVIVLTEDGIMAVSDGGIQMISKVIDSTLKPYVAAPYRTLTSKGAFGVAYESEKVFALFMPALTGDAVSYTARAYVFGLESQAWTTWTYPSARLCGRVDPFTDTAYYGLGEGPWLVKDKNTSSIADYFDYNGAITSTVQWAATTLGAPYATKQAREIHLHYRDVRQPAGQSISSDFTLKTDIQSTCPSIPAWAPGDVSLSTENLIGPAVLPRQFRKLIPQDNQRATYYTLGLTATTSSAGGYWALNGYSIVFEGTSERTGTVR